MAIALSIRRLDANGDMTFGDGLRNFATGSEATAQRIRTAPRILLAEWFLDITKGLPWFGTEDPDDPNFTGVTPILGAAGGANLAYAEALIKAYILLIEGVASLKSFVMEFDHQTRALAAAAFGIDVDGGQFEVEIQNPGP